MLAPAALPDEEDPPQPATSNEAAIALSATAVVIRWCWRIMSASPCCVVAHQNRFAIKVISPTRWRCQAHAAKRCSARRTAGRARKAAKLVPALPRTGGDQPTGERS